MLRFFIILVFLILDQNRLVASRYPGRYDGLKSSNCKIQNNRPIIGVLAQSIEPYINKTYIAASYIKYLESSGARVVPIMNNLSENEIEKMFTWINGVLLPGGDVSLTTSDYARTARTFFNLAKNANDRGDYFPIWGTCQGFEMLSVLVTGTTKILSRTDSENLTLPLKFTSGYRQSKLFREITDNLARSLSEDPLTSNFHDWSVTYNDFKSNEKMYGFYDVLSTSFDREGVEFVSTMEGHNYPVFATQWHPEKNAFEWSADVLIPHGPWAIKAAQYMSNFFVNQARCNDHSFPSLEKEKASLIYNYNVTYTGNMVHFEQCYVFDNKFTPNGQSVLH